MVNTKNFIKKFFGVLLLLLFASAFANAQVKIIFDTDLGGDVDDAGALALLNQLADNGECTILAVMPTSDDQNAFKCIDAINTFYGRPDLPIGIRTKENLSNPDTYAKYVAEHWPNDIDPKSLPLCTSLYRQVLAGQPDHSVVVVIVGQWQNIYDLFHTGGDSYSSLNGKDLFNQKVNYVSAMSGNFPGDSSLTENNMQGIINNESVAQYCIDRIGRFIEFSGGEVGGKIQCGSGFNSLVGKSPVADAYYGMMCVYMPDWAYPENFTNIHDWASFDQTAVLYAVRGLSDYWTEQNVGYCDIWSLNGKIYNQWRSVPNKNQAYLIKKKPLSEMAGIIFDLMSKRTAAARTIRNR